VSEPRPFLLSVVGWLTVVVGVLTVIGGVLALIFHNDILDNTADYSGDAVTAFGIGGIIVGLIYWLVGRGMLNLNGFALGLGVLVSGLAVAGNLSILLSNDTNYTGVWTSLVLNAIVLIACLSGFGARSRARGLS
jgi:peptidoglycan/LPS O-acetylase OafA/YrhL